MGDNRFHLKMALQIGAGYAKREWDINWWETVPERVAEAIREMYAEACAKDTLENIRKGNA